MQGTEPPNEEIRQRLWQDFADACEKNCRPILQPLLESPKVSVESVDAAILQLVAAVLESSVAYAQKVLRQTLSQDWDPAELESIQKRIWKDVRAMFRAWNNRLFPVFTRFIDEQPPSFWDLIEQGQRRVDQAVGEIIASYTGGDSQPRRTIADAGSILGAEQAATRMEDPIFTHSADYLNITYRGQAFTQTGKQRTIIRILHDAHKRRQPVVHEDTLLQAIDSTTEVRSYFRHSPLWGTLVIKGPRKGTFQLNL